MKKSSNTLVPPKEKKKERKKDLKGFFLEEISAFAVFTFPGKGNNTLLFL